MCENLLSKKVTNHEILCRFILFSLLIISTTKIRYTVCNVNVTGGDNCRMMIYTGAKRTKIIYI